ncbi:hypothetical protein GCM10010343_11420 [Streptomyces avidinii]|nr:hypothetical protein GCM10010343_11420 [Streptomyces avidinii]
MQAADGVFVDVCRGGQAHCDAGIESLVEVAVSLPVLLREVSDCRPPPVEGPGGGRVKGVGLVR